MSTKVDQSSDKQPEASYGDNATVLDSDRGYTIWRPVQQKT
jgi:hypothetical protein